MNAKPFIDDFDRRLEAETQRRLDHAEAQRYGEVELELPEAPRNPWDLPSGSENCIGEWKESFVCLRCVSAPRAARSRARPTVRPARARSVVGANIWGDPRAPPPPEPESDSEETRVPGRKQKREQKRDTGGFKLSGGFSDIQIIGANKPRDVPPAAPKSAPSTTPNSTRTRPLPAMPRLPIGPGGVIGEEGKSEGVDRWVADEDG